MSLFNHRSNKKKSWGALRSAWVEPDIRDTVIDFYALVVREDRDFKEFIRISGMSHLQKLTGARDKRTARRREARISAIHSACQGCEAPEGPGLDSHRKYLVYPVIENPPHQ